MTKNCCLLSLIFKAYARDNENFKLNHVFFAIFVSFRNVKIKMILRSNSVYHDQTAPLTQWNSLIMAYTVG